MQKYMHTREHLFIKELEKIYESAFKMDKTLKSECDSRLKEFQDRGISFYRLLFEHAADGRYGNLELGTIVQIEQEPSTFSLMYNALATYQQVE